MTKADTKVAGTKGKFCNTLKDIKEGLYLALAMCFLVFIYAPAETYSYNQNEFWYDIYDLLPVFLPLFFGGFLLLAIGAVIVSKISRKLYNVIFVIGTIGFICTYIQGTFLAGNLPRLDGTVVNWAAYSKENTQSLILWIVVIVVACVIVKFASFEKYIKAAGVVAVCMTLMLLVTMTSFVLTTKSYRGKLNAITTTDTMFEMSQDTNFIILVLDSLDSKTMYDVIQTDEKYRDVFKDFTYYPNAVGTYPYTTYALPHILTGICYQNDESFDDYNIRAYQSSELLNSLEKKGYNINVFMDPDIVPKYGANIFDFDNSHNEFKIGSWFEFAKIQVKLVGLRYAPYQIKYKCMILTEWIDELMVTEGDSTVFLDNNLAFWQSLSTEDITYIDQPVFKYIHLEGAHLPFRYDENMNVVEASTYTECVKASATMADAYLEKLREAGVYDNSVIIVMADHGYSEEQVLYNAFGRQNPILFVKGVGESHELEISEAPISYDDLQEAYKRLLDGKLSADVFDAQEGDERTRRYIYYYYGDEEHMYEYMLEGHAFDDIMTPTGEAYTYE